MSVNTNTLQSLRIYFTSVNTKTLQSLRIDFTSIATRYSTVTTNYTDSAI